MIRIATFLFLLCAAPALSQERVRLPDLPMLYDVTRVADNDTLNVREQPDSKSPVIGQLEPNAEGVEVVGYSTDGNWAQTNHEERAGWISTNFIKESEASSWWNNSARLKCYGTEPFWSLELSTDEESTFQYQGVDDITLTHGWLSESWGRPDWGQPVKSARSFTSPNGPAFASVQSEQCNDGMSDREFHLSIAFMLQNHPVLAGCCSLSAP